MKKYYKFNKFEESLFIFLNWNFALGWLVPIWSRVYRLEFFLTWIGLVFIGLMMVSMKEDSDKATFKNNNSSEENHGT